MDLPIYSALENVRLKAAELKFSRSGRRCCNEDSETEFCRVQVELAAISVFGGKRPSGCTS